MSTSADAAIARRAFRQVRIGASICAVAFGATAASSALTYVSTFPTDASRQQLARSTGGDTGLSVLLGPVSSINTVGGYTVYKGFVFLTTIGAIWALLAATRLLRGEEDSGRWQLALAGATRPARATAAVLAALGAAVGVIFLFTTVLTAAAGRSPKIEFGFGSSLVYGLSIAVPPAVFVGVGAVASQLRRTRRGATSLGIAVFVVTFVLRMVADSGSSARWALWATPFGWTELMRPFTHDDLVPLIPAVVAVLALGATAMVLASVRDTGDAVLASRDVARLRPFGLGSALGMTARLELPVLCAWSAGALASGVMLGMIAKVTTAAPSGQINKTLTKFGVHGGFARQYLGVAFLLVATVVALLPAGQVGAAASEETSGRLVHVLSRATNRGSWFAGRLALGAAAVVASGALAGFGAWLGATSQGVHLGLATLLEAGLNVVPIALVTLGVGAVVLSIAPRAAAATVYSVITWSLIVDLVASLVSRVSWLEHLSLFHYMALAPAERVDAPTLVTTLAAAAALCVVATVVFQLRDLRTD